MKHVLLPILLIIAAVARAAEVHPADNAAEMDSVEVSLLTCEPHDQIYSLYGHTALRYHDLRPGGLDVAFNYGVFNFNAPHFVVRFVFGRTDYELGAYPYRLFLGEYRHFGSQVTEQVLNLTADEKMQLRMLLAENLLPENSTYRYNYFYNNCTTKARDVVEQCINGRVEYTEREAPTETYRQAIHRMTANNPWARFGNDLLLGIGADQPTTPRQQEFLPATLMRHFDRASIVSNGTSRPLVLQRRTAVEAGTQTIGDSFPLRPLWCGLILLALDIVLAAVQKLRHSYFRWWDVALMTATATLGTVLFLMLFSSHPTVSLNLQLLLFNPLPWCCVWNVARGRPTRYWRLTLLLGAAFFAGSLFQHYAEGLWCLALCLLLQCCIHIKWKH